MASVAPIKSLHDHFVSLAHKYPTRPALLSCDEQGETVKEITHAELLQQIEVAAAYLHSLSLQKGDRVALAFKNSAELLILSWAAWASGIITVPLDTKRDTAELCAYKINLNKAKVLIVQKGALENIGTQEARVVEFSRFSSAESVAIDWEPTLAHPALILFTSGTTSHPKGAKLSLENLMVNAQSIREWLRITEEDRFLVQLPLHHINSTTFCLSTLLAGGTIAIPPAYSNSRFWEQAAQTHATFTSIVQSILADQVERTEEYEAVKSDIKLNRIQIGSAPVVAHTVQEFIRKFNIPLYQGYGQTETALRVTGVPMGLPQALYDQLVEENCIGTAMSWADLQVADKEGKILGESEEGELVVKGAANMEGYVGGESAFRDDYFLTGDVGLYKTIDGQRFFYLKGRSREIIIKGGVNISPVAVENSLKKISADIAQVYCIGVEDERYGEEVGAVICWRAGIDTDAAMRRLKLTLISGSDFLGAYEVPRYLAVVSPEDLPLTSTGKVQRTVIKNTVHKETFTSLWDILAASRYRFSILAPHSPYVAVSHALYNHAWQPLNVDFETYKKDIPKQFIFLAVDAEDKLAGQIAIVRTNFSSDQLLRTKYADLLTPAVDDPRGSALICVSICSAQFKPQPVPEVSAIPDPATVRTYLEGGNDPVMRFHQKPKGGLSEGAALVDVIPAGRPEDTSALGYNMLLKYPAPLGSVKITEDAPVSDQLIEIALLAAHDRGLKDVYAYSRPGGLASYLSKR